MIAELPTSFRRVALRLLPIVCLLFSAHTVLAQSAVNYCEPSAAVKEEFKKLREIDEADLPYKVAFERQVAMLQDLMKKYPGDFHVQRRYQFTRTSGYFVDKEPLYAEYRALMEKNPSDPIAVYLYAYLLVGKDTKQSIELLKKLSQQSPEFPWTYLQLAEIYNYPNFRDTAKAKEQLKQFVAKCPEAPNALWRISRSGDKEMIANAAQRLRQRLEASTSNDDLLMWGDVWTLEFKLKPVPEHAQYRKQIAEDLKRIREKFQTSKEQLQALVDGYKQIGDKAAQRAIEDEIVRMSPKSSNTRRLIQSRFYDEHPYPKGETTEAQRQAYNQALVQVTGEWIKQWPDDERSWSTRVRSLTGLEKSSKADVETAYEGYTKAHERGFGLYSVPPLELSVARFYLKHGFNLDRIPALLEKGLTEIEHNDKNSYRTDLYARGEDEEGNLRWVRLDAWPLLAETYARLKQPDKALEVLAKLNGISMPPKRATDAQKKKYNYSQSVYWQAVGKVAELERRKLDALMAYQTVLSFRTSAPRAGAKDELSDDAQRLWKELGGTDQGWQAYLARKDASKSKPEAAEVATWDSKNTALPDFELSDLEGRKWSTADLKGKVALVNFWATWCGPCRDELPYVQKLREQMKDKKDVLVLTLNIDDEVGKVEPFMKENKYTFPVLLGQAYADSQSVNSIPRNWIISADGKVMFEGIGFGGEGEEWIKKATQMIEKVKTPN